MSIINTIQVTKNLIVNILYLIYHYISYYFTIEKTIRNTSSFDTSDTTHNSNYVSTLNLIFFSGAQSKILKWKNVLI